MKLSSIAKYIGVPPIKIQGIKTKAIPHIQKNIKWIEPFFRFWCCFI